MGLFNQSWIELQNRTKEPQNGSTLLTKTIKIFLSVVVTKWKDRCSHLHRTTTTITKNRQRLQDKIRLLYTFQPDVLPQDRQIFNLPIQTTKHISPIIHLAISTNDKTIYLSPNGTDTASSPRHCYIFH